MAQLGEPLWVQTADNSSHETLSEDEYLQSFPRGIGPKPMGLKSEASRESKVVIMNHMTLVEILMDVNQWSNVFCGIVSRAMTLEVLSTGVAGNYNGALQMMTAEYQVPSPLVPTRENYSVRYCKQHADGTWVVVDVSLDNLRSSSVSRCRRRPFGYLIQELPNGYSKVLVNSGLAFGAKRWVATLESQKQQEQQNQQWQARAMKHMKKEMRAYLKGRAGTSQPEEEGEDEDEEDDFIDVGCVRWDKFKQYYPFASLNFRTLLCYVW